MNFFSTIILNSLSQKVSFHFDFPTSFINASSLLLKFHMKDSTKQLVENHSDLTKM